MLASGFLLPEYLWMLFQIGLPGVRTGAATAAVAVAGVVR